MSESVKSLSEAPAKTMQVIDVPASVEELQSVVDAYMTEHGHENWKVTVSDQTESHLGKIWVVCEDKIVSGYGSNHRPEKSYFAFAIENGRLIVADTMSDEALQEMLEQ